MSKILGLVTLFILIQSQTVTAHPEGGLTKQEFFDWRMEELPYAISDRTRHQKVDTQFLKAQLNDRLREIYSTQFLFLPITVKTFVNDGVFSILGTAALAANAIPSPVTLAGEALSVVQIIFNQAMYGEVTDSLTLTNLLTMGINILVSENVNHDVIEPLAKIYDQVGMNVRGMYRLQMVGIPFSLFNYVQPWFDVPDLNLLPIWASSPELTSLPVDWLLAEDAFDLAVFTLRFAAKHPELRNEAYNLYNQIASRICDATKPGNDIDGDDLEGLIQQRTVVSPKGKYTQVTLDQSDSAMSDVDKLDVLVNLKQRISSYLTEDDDKLYQTQTEHGHIKGSFAQILGGYLSCMVSDTLYASLTSEMLSLESEGKIFQGGRSKTINHANLSNLPSEKRERYKKLFSIIREKDFNFTYSTKDKYALTDGEKTFLKDRAFDNEFTMKNCVYRYANRYFPLDQMGPKEMKENLSSPMISYLEQMELRVKAAQANVQRYGRNLKNDKIEAYSLK